MNDFRQEKKIIFEKKQLHFLISFLKNNRFIKIYPDRKIFSIYYDTNSLKLYRDSEEGLAPRKKVRIRSYSKNFKDGKIYFEEKITLFNNRKKISKVIPFNKLPNRIFDKKYGFLYPKVSISYTRTYYSNTKFRITLDRKINYSPFISFDKLFKFNCVENLNALEIKYDDVIPEYIFQKHFNLKTARFSKYCNAISSLQKDLNY
jgi:hypothetical protein